MILASLVAKDGAKDAILIGITKKDIAALVKGKMINVEADTVIYDIKVVYEETKEKLMAKLEATYK